MQEKTVLPPAMLAEEIHCLMLQVNTMQVVDYIQDFDYLALKSWSQFSKGEAGCMNFAINLGLGSSDDELISVGFMYSEENAQWEMCIRNLDTEESWMGVPVDDLFPEVVGILEENLNPLRAE